MGMSNNQTGAANNAQAAPSPFARATPPPSVLATANPAQYGLSAKQDVAAPNGGPAGMGAIAPVQAPAPSAPIPGFVKSSGFGQAPPLLSSQIAQNVAPPSFSTQNAPNAAAPVGVGAMAPATNNAPSIRSSLMAGMAGSGSMPPPGAMPLQPSAMGAPPLMSSAPMPFKPSPVAAHATAHPHPGHVAAALRGIGRY